MKAFWGITMMVYSKIWGSDNVGYLKNPVVGRHRVFGGLLNHGKGYPKSLVHQGFFQGFWAPLLGKNSLGGMEKPFE